MTGNLLYGLIDLLRNCVMRLGRVGITVHVCMNPGIGNGGTSPPVCAYGCFLSSETCFWKLFQFMVIMAKPLFLYLYPGYKLVSIPI